MNWIKDKLKKFWKFIIFGVLGVSVALAATVAIPSDNDLESQVDGVGSDVVEKVIIISLLDGKTAEQKADIKGVEIAKIGTVTKTDRNTYSIEITEMNAIKGGVEVMARAWDENGQIGFGKDGTVDIEKFNIYNPPILVGDPNGTIIREWTDDDGISHQIKLREDLLEATLQVLEHTIKVKQQKFGSSNIIPDKIGNTTSTFFPAAGANSPVDGFAKEENNFPTGVAWATLKGGSGVSASVTGASEIVVQLRSGNTTDKWDRLDRGIFLFNTSAISPDVVDSATFSLVAIAKADPFATAVTLVSSSPANNDNLVASDWATLGSTRLATDISISSINIDGSTYNNWILNASGESNIDISGISKFGVLADQDFDNTEPSWSISIEAFIRAIMADEAGTAEDPKLVVEHSVPPPAIEPRPRRLEIIIIE